MILSDQQMGEILEGLLKRTLEHKLPWYQENNRLFVELPNRTSVELAPDVEGPGFVVQVKGPSDDVYGQLRSSNGQESVAARLYKAACEQAAKSVFVEIMDSLNVIDSPSA